MQNYKDNHTVFNHLEESFGSVDAKNNFTFKSPFALSPIEKTILQAIRKKTTLSKKEISEITGFSRTTVSNSVNSLIEKETILQAGLSTSSGGRPSTIYKLNDKKGLLLGVDIGATSLDLLGTTLSGKRLFRHSEHAVIGDGPDLILRRICDLLHDLLEIKNITDNILGIGIGVPGPVDFNSGMVVSPPIMPGWDQYPIIEFMSQEFPDTLVVVDNDVNIMAIGEHAIGKAVGIDNFIYVKIGTGIGAGIILNNQIFRGSEGCAGDIGHICVDKNGPICSCGNIGCLESLAGGNAISRIAEKATFEGKSSELLSEKLNKSTGTLSAKDVGQAAQEGDQFSIELIRECGFLIGDVLSSLVNFMNPQMIVLGGGVSNFGGFFLSTIRQTILNRSLPLATKNLEVVFSAIPNDVGVVGAINLVMDIVLTAAMDGHIKK
jgi:glucokinase-like ROK family protein